MVRKIVLLFWTLALVIAGGKAASPQQPNVEPFAYQKEFDKDSALFSFVQVTDTHIITGKPVDSIKKGIEDINLLRPQPKFAVVTGDLIDGAEPEASTKLYKELFSRLRCPLFSVYGNHDNREEYKKLLGKFNYSFYLPPYHFIVLDNIDTEDAKDTYDGKFSECTVAWLKEHLQSVSKKVPIILFCHATVYREGSYSAKLPGDAHNYEAVLELLKPYNVVAWFAGHAHCNALVRKEGVDYFTTGCLSDNRGNSGCPLGYLIVTVYKDRVETSYRPITDFVAPIVVAQDGSGDFNGKDERPILEAIKKVSKTGGTIFIKPGEYLVRTRIGPQNNITFTGTPQTVLRLPYPVLTTAAAEKGQDFLMVGDTSELAAGIRLQVFPPVGMKAFPGGDETQLEPTVKAVKKGKLLLAEPLPCTVPQKSRVGCRYNHIFCMHGKKNIIIKNLVMDGGRKPDIPMPGHCERCAILATGPNTYADGLTGPPTENVQVINCHIRNCYGRAVTMYGVVHSKVEGCLIENIDDDAIGFDHYCYYCQAIGNDVKNSHRGVNINDGSYCTVEYNRFTNCGRPVIVWWWHLCPKMDIDIGNKIRHNFIYSPKREAISIGGRCFWNEVSGNFVEGSIKVAEPNNVVEENHTLR